MFLENLLIYFKLPRNGHESASEIIRLRWDARQREAGFIDPPLSTVGQGSRRAQNDSPSHLWLHRSKSGVNPFALIHPALADCLRALSRWRQSRPYAKHSPWFLPSPRHPGRPIGKKVLSHALRLLQRGPLKLDTRTGILTSHGLRSFYVTLRRSEGASDAQIAAEIGDKTGAHIIVTTYGSVPPNWRGGHPLTWLPDADAPPAWQHFPECQTSFSAGMAIDSLTRPLSNRPSSGGIPLGIQKPRPQIPPARSPKLRKAQ